MNRLLQALGLMRVSEQPVDPETDWEAKFKKAITDLAAAREEVAGLAENVASMKNLAARRDDLIRQQTDEIKSLRPDALAMRLKRERDRDRRKGKVNG